jgi:hypothetical protein
LGVFLVKHIWSGRSVIVCFVPVWMNRWSYGNVWMPGSPLCCSHWKLRHSYDIVGNIFLQEFNIGLTGYIQLSFFWNVMNSGLSTNWDQGPVVGPYLHIVVVVTIYPLAHG